MYEPYRRNSPKYFFRKSKKGAKATFFIDYTSKQITYNYFSAQNRKTKIASMQVALYFIRPLLLLYHTHNSIFHTHR